MQKHEKRSVQSLQHHLLALRKRLRPLQRLRFGRHDQKTAIPVYPTAFPLDPAVAEHMKSIKLVIQTHAVLASKQLVTPELMLVRPVAQYVCMELWLGFYQHAPVMVKKLPIVHISTLNDLDLFHHEIQWLASVTHHNIVRVCGISTSCSAAGPLALVMEPCHAQYPNIRTFLAQTRSHNRRLCEWTSYKLAWALAIARGLLYLSQQRDFPLRKFDLTTKNIMLTPDWQPKLMNLVISAHRFPMTLTIQHPHRDGAMFWKAPETLGIASYNPEKATVYSFGILLSELDTHNEPFEHTRHSMGRPLGFMDMLQQLQNGSLRSDFSSSCPAPVRQLAEQCLQYDASSRPTIQAMVTSLEILCESSKM